MATDITVTTTQYTDADRSWLLAELSALPGPVGGRTSYAIDYSKFTLGTQYTTTDRYIKSGTVVGIVTATGKIGPYTNGASDGTQNAIGFLFDNEVVPSDTTQVAAVAVLDAFATISQANLPANSGNDSTARTALASRFFLFRA